MPTPESVEPKADTVTENPQQLADLAQQVHRIGEENRRLFQQLLAGEKRFRSLAKAVWRVQEQERRRLAGELHDGLGQTLTALKIQLERLAASAQQDDPQLAEAISQAAAISHEALGEARRLSHLLRPKVLDDLGLAAALSWLARTLKDWTDFDVRLDLEGLEDRRLAPDLETLIFRVVQESLNNTLKHSGARYAEVTLERVPRRRVLRLRVVDGGSGFDPRSGRGGYGLRGMRDRVEVFGGRLAVRSSPGEGTTIEAELPLVGEDEEP